VPRSCIYDLWEAFNDIAEGFGLTMDEFQEILKSALLETLSVTERVLNNDAEKAFQLLDDDKASASPSDRHLPGQSSSYLFLLL
jgi:hypothetical protein